VSFGELGGTTAGVETSTKLASKDAVDDEVDGRIGSDQQITDVVIVEVHLTHTHRQAQTHILNDYVYPPLPFAGSG